MINTPLQRYLRSRGACRQARKWAGRKSLREAWATCTRTDWLLWLVEAEASRVYEAAMAEPRRVYRAARAEPERVYESGASPDEFRAQVACSKLPRVRK